MKVKHNKNGTVTMVVSEELYSVLTHLAGDLGAENCVLRYDTRLYGKWSAPLARARKLLRKFAATSPDYCDWADHFEELDRPRFAKRDG